MTIMSKSKNGFETFYPLAGAAAGLLVEEYMSDLDANVPAATTSTLPRPIGHFIRRSYVNGELTNDAA